MIIYKDILLGDELFTDAYRPKLLDDGTLEWSSKLVTRSEGGIDDKLIGGNASAEEAAEESETATKTGFDFELDGNLEKQEWDKKTFLQWFKGFAKKAVAKVDEDKVGDAKATAKKFMEKVTEAFKAKKDLCFYSGASLDEEADIPFPGNVIALVWNDDGMSGTAFCWADGLKQEKV